MEGQARGVSGEEQEGTPLKPGSHGRESLPHLAGTGKQAGLSRARRRAVS